MKTRRPQIHRFAPDDHNDRETMNRKMMISRFLNQRTLLTGIMGVSVSLCGCTGLREYIHNGFKVGPNYQRPAAPVAPQWIDAEDARVHSQPVDDSHWWKVFGDPVLDCLVQTAYQQNLPLKEAGFRVLQARAQLGIAVGNFFPQTQELIADAERRGVSVTVANRVATPVRWFNIFDTGFTLSWELDFWGRYRRSIESAEATYNVYIEDYDSILVMTVGDVARYYAQVRTLQQQIDYTRTNIDLQRKTLDLVQIRFENGAVSDLDVEQAKTNVARTEAFLPPLEISLRQAMNSLCILLGIPPENLVKKIGLGPIPVTPKEVCVGIPADLLRRRPDVREAERRVAAQSAQIGVATSQLFPHISLNGTIGYQTSKLRDLFSDQSIFGTAGPSVQWSILNYGRLVNQIHVEDAKFQELVANYQNKVLTANQEVENGLVAFLQSQDQAQSLAKAVAAARKSVDIALIQYREGKVDFNRVFTLERDLVTYMDDLAQAQGAISQGLVAIYRALGGGWQIRCDPPQTCVLPLPTTTNGAPTGPAENLPQPRKQEDADKPKVEAAAQAKETES